ncbi:MAG TPA: hypothetical protein VMG10_01585 [Gemmataceae bacterium]|nr:hypothetical protein [Gemmataceae bacterium]
MELSKEQTEAFVPPIAASSEEGHVAAWEQIEEGRYMPRRVRGSCQGRELG